MAQGAVYDGKSKTLQKADMIKQKTEVRGRKSEGREQKSEVGGWKDKRCGTY
jgi:hypothetical protein